MQKHIIAFLSAAVIFSFSVAQVSADGTSYGSQNGTPCVPVYGGGTQCPRPGQVLINKKVKNPASGVFVDNLGPTDPKYRPQQVVIFRITVQNPGDSSIDSITVTDTLPDFVDFMTGPGAYNSSTRGVTFTVTNLASSESRDFDVTARVVHPAVLPNEKNVVCPVNIVQAQSDFGNDRDEAQFCIEKVMEVPVVPKAGPEMWMIPGLTSVFAIGAYLRKKVRV